MKKSAIQKQVASEYYTQVAQAYATGDEASVQRWKKAVGAAWSAADRLSRDEYNPGAAYCTKKAAEAAASGQPAIADLWTQAAKGDVIASSHYTQVAEAYASGDEAAAQRWDKAAKAAQAAARRLGGNKWIPGAACFTEDAAKAEASGKPVIADLYTQAAQAAVVASNHHTQAAQAYASGDEVTAQRWDKVAEVAKAAAYRLGGAEIGQSEYVTGAANFTEKAAKARASGQPDIADLYTTAAKGAVVSSNHYTQAAQAYASGDEAAAQRWDKAAQRWDKVAEAAEEAANYLSGWYGATAFIENAAKAAASGKPAIADLWTQAAQAAVLASIHYTQAAQAYATGDEATAMRWHKVAEAAGAAASHLGGSNFNVGVASFTEKATEAEASGKPVIADLYTQAAKGAVVLSNHYTQAAQAYATGDEAAAQRWDKAAKTAKNAADHLGVHNGAALYCIEKAAEATAYRKPIIAEIWTQAARQAQSTSDCYLLLSQSVATGADEAIIEQNEQAAQAADEVLKQLVKDAEAAEAARK